jgi:polyhydroxyalkanoate synthase
MNDTPSHEGVAPRDAASQHGAANHAAPRPLPLFLALVQSVAALNPALARAALDGLHAYMDAPRIKSRKSCPKVAEVGGASLRDHGGNGPPIILVPSLINPPHILDLDEETSLASALTKSNRVLLVDWGKANDRAALDVAQHVEKILLPLIATLDEPAVLIGYCLGGTMALAAAQLAPVAGVATLAAPWHFDRYDDKSRGALSSIWRDSRLASHHLGALPMEVLQAAFWALDPDRTVTKFARFGTLNPASDEARRFVAMEDWANQGEPLPLPAASELFDGLFAADQPGRGEWVVAGHAMHGRAPCPTLHLLARDDHIVPAATAPDGDQIVIPSGHVGMIVGRARGELHQRLGEFIALAGQAAPS